MAKRLFSLAISAIFLMTLVYIGCSGSDDSAEEPGGPFELMLAHIPDIPDSRQSFAVVDIATLRSELGIDVPGDEAGWEEVTEYQIAIMLRIYDELGVQLSPNLGGAGSDNWLSGFARADYGIDETTYDSLGFDSRNVDQIASFGWQVPRYREVLLGSFSPAVTSERLTACGDCEPHDLVTHSGTDYYAWGDDFKQSLGLRLAKPAYDNLGRGGRILVQEGMASRTLSSEHMEEIIDASTGMAASLADDPNYVLAASLLTKFETGTARFIGNDFSVEDALAQMEELWNSGLPRVGTIEEIERQFTNANLLQPYEVAAVGIAFPKTDGAAPDTYAVLVYSTAAGAEENAERLKQRIEQDEHLLTSPLPMYGQTRVDEPITWADFFDDYEVTTEGRAVVLRVTAGTSGNNLSRATLWEPHEPMFIHNLLVSE